MIDAQGTTAGSVRAVTQAARTSRCQRPHSWGIGSSNPKSASGVSHRNRASSPGFVSRKPEARNGDAVERIGYDPYGDISYFDASWTARTGSSYANNVGFTGRWHDSTGMIYFRARYYDPVLGRFVQRDPLRYVDGMSLYPGYFVPGGMDPSGMYDLTFRGDNWTQQQRDDVNKSLDRVKQRIDSSLLPDINKKIDQLKKDPCNKYDCLIRHLEHLKDVLSKLSDSIGSHDSVDVYHWDQGADHTDRRAYTRPFLGHVNYNDTYAGTDGWTTNNLDTLNLHEFSHLYGTEDTDYSGSGAVDDYNDAHSIEKLMTQDLDGWSPYKIDKSNLDHGKPCH